MFTDVLAQFGAIGPVRAMDATTSSTGAMAASSSSAASSSGAPSSSSTLTSPTTTILVGTLTTCNRDRRYTVATGLAAANSGVTAATFFSLREFFVRPLLRDHVPPPISVRRENLIESGVSGALTGGLLRGIRSGPPAAVSGALILGTLTTSLQYAFNAVRARPPPSSSTSASLSYADPTQLSTQSATPTQSTGKTTTHRLTDTLLALFGIYPITLDEQIASLKRKRDAHVRKIREIEDRLGLEHDEGLVPGERVKEGQSDAEVTTGKEGSKP
ncbi:hypothetical protein EV715DRAFT_288602 [Schizophyllum commune]